MLMSTLPSISTAGGIIVTLAKRMFMCLLCEKENTCSLSQPVVEAHTFNPSIREAEAGESL